MIAFKQSFTLFCLINFACLLLGLGYNYHSMLDVINISRGPNKGYGWTHSKYLGGLWVKVLGTLNLLTNYKRSLMVFYSLVKCSM
jgi:hypothetical protein